MIVLLGIVGSGKGTQAQILAKRLDCPIITTGDILRSQRDDPRVKAAVDNGALVTDDVLLPMLEDEFKRIGADKNEFILDGTPRNVEQAGWLVNKVKKGEIKLRAVIHLNLSLDAALKRLQLRGRHDDNEATINER